MHAAKMLDGLAMRELVSKVVQNWYNSEGFFRDKGKNQIERQNFELHTSIKQVKK